MEEQSNWRTVILKNMKWGLNIGFFFFLARTSSYLHPQKVGRPHMIWQIGAVRRSSTTKLSLHPNSVTTPKKIECPHFEECSGCVAQKNLDALPIMKRAKRYLESCGVNPIIEMGNVTQWRTHAKLAIQPQSKWGGIKIGLYKQNSHVALSIPQCAVQHPNINYAVELIRSIAVNAGVKGYVEPNEKCPHSEGELRYVQLSVHRLTGELQMTLVINARQYRECSPAVYRMMKELTSSKWEHLWHSIFINFHPKSSNTIFNYDEKSWVRFLGHKYLPEIIGNHTFFLPPQAFRQANLDAFEKSLLPYVQSFVQPGADVVELYSGLGIIGFNLHCKAPHSVVCVDNNPFLAEPFALAKEKSSPRQISFHALTAAQAVEAGLCDHKSLMIVDPPRKGLDPEVLDFLTDKHANKGMTGLERLIYVSCGFEAAERDCNVLLQSQKWKLVAARGFVLFPGSDHIETVFVFDRVRNNVVQEKGDKKEVYSENLSQKLRRLSSRKAFPNLSSRSKSRQPGSPTIGSNSPQRKISRNHRNSIAYNSEENRKYDSDTHSVPKNSKQIRGSPSITSIVRPPRKISGLSDRQRQK